MRICKHVDEEIDLDGISVVYVPTITIPTFVAISSSLLESVLKKESEKRRIYRRAIHRLQRASHTHVPIPFPAEEKCSI